jgi:hypothetical protein
MKTEIEDLLTRLEELSAEAVDRSDPAQENGVDTLQVRALLQERGRLIEELQPVLAANAPVSYLEWNRIVIIHHQGSRIQENLVQTRNQVALDLRVNSSGRVFLDRVSSMIAPALNQV